MTLLAISVENTDHFAKGGVKALTLGTFDGTASFTAAADHEVTYTAAAAVVTVGFEKETCKITSSTSQEKGLAMTTVSIECYIPKISGVKYKSLEALKGKTLYAKADLWDGDSFILGWDSVLGGTGTAGTDFGLFLESIESDSGAALADQNGVTLKLTGIQGEEPRTVV